MIPVFRDARGFGVTSSEGVAIRLRVFPDYAADPVWADTGMVDLDSLSISDDLVTALRAWARAWETLMGVEAARYEIDDVAAHETWQRQGRHLTLRLQRELGSTHRVEYVP